jgi:hypothetical protein
MPPPSNFGLRQRSGPYPAQCTAFPAASSSLRSSSAQSGQQRSPRPRGTASVHASRVPPARSFTGGRPYPACRESNVLLHDHRRAPGPGRTPPRDCRKRRCKVGVVDNRVGTVCFAVRRCNRASPPIAPKPPAASPPATRSLLAALRGRDGLVHRLVDAEDLRQSGDLQDLQDPLLRADQVQRAVVGPHPLQAPD